MTNIITSFYFLADSDSRVPGNAADHTTAHLDIVSGMVFTIRPPTRSLPSSVTLAKSSLWYYSPIRKMRTSTMRTKWNNVYEVLPKFLAHSLHFITTTTARTTTTTTVI